MTGHTLVIQTAFLGDVVLTLPLIQQLADQFGPVDVVVTPEAEPLATGQPAVRRAIVYDKRGADRGVAGFRKMARLLRAKRYQRAFLPHRSLRSALLVRQAGVPERTGFAGGIAGLLHTRSVARAETGHESERLAALAPAPAPVAAPWLVLGSTDRERAAAWLTASGIGPPYVVLAPGARWATKRWPGFPALAREFEHPVVVIGGPDDRAAASAIVAAAPNGRSAAGELSLLQSAALIERAALVVSNDSVALHLAVALGRPVLGVAGPTGPASGFEPPPGAGGIVAHPELACRPCSRHGHDRCPLGHHRCMTELEPATVLSAVTAALTHL
ncbi:MAG TPA: lipopolysaccharide heptosyltransferase II [Gemmatimonadales bacterium]|nr:lipopolysaccharide heptosyltransferase II [Gemmatimonadales bacterium]